MQEKLSYFRDNFAPLVGVVEEIIDESYVRVRCYGIHPLDKTKVATDQLPPALVLYPTTGGQVGGGNLSHNLEVDSWVFGYFLDYPLCMQPIVTHAVQGSTYSMSTYKTNGGEFVGQGSNNSGSSSSNGSGSSENPTDIDINATTNIPGGSNVEKTYNYVFNKLKSEGSSTDPHLHTSALVGVLQLESTPTIKPEIVNGIGAWGICQWLGPRKRRLFSKFGQTKRLDNQLDFMWWELNNTERPAKGKWLRATNLPDAVAGFCSFERAEEWTKRGTVDRSHKNYKIRLQYAYKIYNSMKYTGGTS